MEKQTSLRIWLELVWWTVTAVAVVAVLWPIQKSTANYPFFWENIAFIVCSITLARYSFQIKHAFFSKMQVVKIALTVVLLPLIFVLVGTLNDFMGWIEANEYTSITGHLAEPERSSLNQYIWGEMLFFATASILAAATLWVRVIISLWRTHNLGTA